MLCHRTEMERGAGPAYFTSLTDQQRAELLGDEHFIHQPLAGADGPDVLSMIARAR